MPPSWKPSATKCGGVPWTTNLDEVLADPKYSIYFDSQTTDRRATDVKKAIAAGKNIYCEKPVADSLAVALELLQLAEAAGVKHGVVQDKLWLPGLRKLQTLKELGFFGRIFSVRGEFGYWVFEGDTVKAQRPSWNYRKEDGGGIIIDMLCHWRYVLDNLFGPVKAVSCLGATHIPTRWDESGLPYQAHRGRRGLRLLRNRRRHHRPLQFVLVRARAPRRSADHPGRRHQGHCRRRPARVLDPALRRDAEAGVEPRHRRTRSTSTTAGRRCPEQDTFDNAFKIQWELFLRHVVEERAVPLGSDGRRQRRPAGREGHRELAETRLGRHPGALSSAACSGVAWSPPS